MASVAYPAPGLVHPPASAVMRRLTNAVYLLAVLAMIYTLSRPSPVDILFTLALVLSVVSGQVITRNVLVFITLALTWIASMFVSSIRLLDDPDVVLYLVKISYAISIGICSALVSACWTRVDLDRFVRFFVVSAACAAMLGTLGFLTGNETLTWDGRASGFLDDPNMFGSFLLTGLIGCMYLIWRGGWRVVYVGLMAMLMLGVTLSFSRAAITSFLLWGGLYYVFLNRKALPRAIFYLLFIAGIAGLCVLIASETVPMIAEKLADRSTIAKSYDLGHGGRYSRYLMSLEIILENPLGLGVLELTKIFEEPIHNLWLSSFVNYGWVAGFAFTFLVIFSISISVSNYRQTQDPLLAFVFVAWLAVLSCALLHEAERWRHFWLVTGLVWGMNTRNFVWLPSLRRRPLPPIPANDSVAIGAMTARAA